MTDSDKKHKMPITPRMGDACREDDMWSARDLTGSHARSRDDRRFLDKRHGEWLHDMIDGAEGSAQDVVRIDQQRTHEEDGHGASEGRQE